MRAVTAESERMLAASDSQAKSSRGQVLRLDIPSSLRTLEVVDVFIGEVASSAGFDQDSTQDVQIAVHEAVINAIVHGNGGEESRRVRLEVAVGPAGLEVVVQDQGRGFDPSVVPDPLAPSNLCRSCGRGVFFMRSLMDEVSFRRVADGGTQVRMLKRRARVD